jgi:hypothetical protein
MIDGPRLSISGPMMQPFETSIEAAQQAFSDGLSPIPALATWLRKCVALEPTGAVYSGAGNSPTRKATQVAFHRCRS